jgi:hypothetical protein
MFFIYQFGQITPKPNLVPQKSEMILGGAADEHGSDSYDQISYDRQLLGSWMCALKLSTEIVKS